MDHCDALVISDLDSVDSSTASITELEMTLSLCFSVAVWCSGNASVSINAAAIHLARLVLGWVTAFG